MGQGVAYLAAEKAVHAAIAWRPAVWTMSEPYPDEDALPAEAWKGSGQELLASKQNE